MKKRLLILALSGITLVSLASCNKKDTDSSATNVEAENKIIEEYSENFLMDTFGLDGFKIEINQSYTVNKSTENDKEKTDYNLNYLSKGIYSYYYAFDEEVAEEDINYKKVLKDSSGYLRAYQTETFDFSYAETDKTIHDSKEKKENQAVKIENDYIADFFGDNLTFYSDYAYTDSIDSTQNDSQDYAGKYAKTDVADAYTNDALTNFIDNLVYLDSYFEYKVLNNYIMDRLADTTTEEVDTSDLIDGESIEIKEENGCKVIAFNLNTKDLFKDLFELESDTDDVYITGSFIFDAEYQALTAFKFDFTNFLKKLFDLSEDDMKVSNVSFIVDGKEFDPTKDFEIIEIEPKTYDSVDAFANDLIENTSIYSQMFDEDE